MASWPPDPTAAPCTQWGAESNANPMPAPAHQGTDLTQSSGGRGGSPRSGLLQGQCTPEKGIEAPRSHSPSAGAPAVHEGLSPGNSPARTSEIWCQVQLTEQVRSKQTGLNPNLQTWGRWDLGLTRDGFSTGIMLGPHTPTTCRLSGGAYVPTP